MTDKIKPNVIHTSMAEETKLLHPLVNQHEPIEREDDGRMVYPCYVAGIMDDGTRFDVMVEFVKPITPELIEDLKTSLNIACGEILKRHKEG